MDQDSREKKDVWDGASNSLSRILQTVEDVNYRVVDIPKNHKRRKKVHTFEDVVDLRGDTRIKMFFSFYNLYVQQTRVLKVT